MKIIEEIERANQEVVKKFSELVQNYDSVPCAVSDSMDRVNAMTSDMKPLFEVIRFVELL